jgi:hypothetical protein
MFRVARATHNLAFDTSDCLRDDFCCMHQKCIGGSNTYVKLADRIGALHDTPLKLKSAAIMVATP